MPEFIGPLELDGLGSIPKMSPELVQEARRLYRSGLSLREVAEALSVMVGASHARGLFVFFVAFLVSCVSLFKDAKVSRRDLVRHTGGGMPHSEVRTRLGPSPLHGVGVFAISEISEGTELFPFDKEEPYRIKRRAIRGLTHEQVRLYEDFCLIDDHGARLGCPRSFGLMGMSWYLNHSSDPNVRVDEVLRFFAIRKIARGEELTVDYLQYNDFGDDIPEYVARKRLIT